MTTDEFVELCRCGETTKVQYKECFTTQTKIAQEMVAFANTHGGVILFGVQDKTGKMLGLTFQQLQDTGLELGNTANEQVKPAIYIETETVKVGDMRFLVCHIAEGRNKPYKTNVRALRENVVIDFINEDEANQFRVIIWRTTQKEVIDAQRAEFATQNSNICDEVTTQKAPKTTQKDLSATQKAPKTTQKDLSATQKAVLEYFRNYPKGTRADAANAIPDLSEDGVKYLIGRLQQLGVLKREGGRKDGYWVVIDE